VRELVETLLGHWPGHWQPVEVGVAPHESAVLLLDARRARSVLGWEPRWRFTEALSRTAQWYQGVHAGQSAQALCLAQLAAYGAC
ncbi:MAG: CDP-glucose 4,6-dehydratase, partial [Synechococcus sp.]